MHTRTIGASQVLLAGVFWGTYGTFASFLPESISPLAVGAIKLAIGAIGLAVILMVSHRGRIISKGTRFPIPTLHAPTIQRFVRTIRAEGTPKPLLARLFDHHRPGVFFHGDFRRYHSRWKPIADR